MELQKLDIDRLKALLVELYDGNAGEILNGLREMGLKGERYKAALIRYIERAQGKS